MEELKIKIEPIKMIGGLPIYKAYKLNQLFDLGQRYISIWTSSIKEIFTVPYEKYAPLDMVIKPFIITCNREYIFICCRYDDDCLRAFKSPKYKKDEMVELVEQFSNNKD